MSLESISAIGDVQLDALPADSFATVKELIRQHTGIDLTMHGSRVTLSHPESGTHLVKEASITILGAFRTAAHLARFVADARSLAPEPADRFSHARRRRP